MSDDDNRRSQWSNGSSTPGHAASTGSPFVRRNVDFLISLLPSLLSNVKSNVSQSLLEENVLRYSREMEGVLLAFDNVEFVDKNNKRKRAVGRIMNELPHIHYRMRARVLLFSPRVGMKLVGSVNEWFPSHVGLLVHCLFNAMVSAEHLRRAGYEFDYERQCWKRNVNDVPMELGEEVPFWVEKIHESYGTISLEGSLRERRGDGD